MGSRWTRRCRYVIPCLIPTSQPGETFKNIGGDEDPELGMTTRGNATREKCTHFKVLLLIMPLRSNFASTSKHHMSAMGAMVRGRLCPVRVPMALDETSCQRII